MKNIILNILFLIVSVSMYSQYDNKRDLYFHSDSEKNSECQYKLDIETEIYDGIQFNFCGEMVVRHYFEMYSDTIHKSKISKFEVSRSEDLSKIIDQWNSENKVKIKSYYKGYNVEYGKNKMFNTYIIKNHKKDSIIIFPVKWISDWVEK